MLCRSTQDGWVTEETSDKMSSTGQGNGKPFQYSCLENPIKRMKREKAMTLKDELPRFIEAKNLTGENYRKNEEMEPKQKTKPSCGCD